MLDFAQIQPMDLNSLVGFGVTVFAYVCALWVFRRFNNNVLVHPIILGAMIVAIVCVLIDRSITEYHQSVGYFNWLLGPITVALAVPLFQQLKLIVQSGIPALFVIILGGVMGPLVAFVWLYLFESSSAFSLSVLTKSITTPLAIETSENIGGIPEFAAAIVIITGVFGVLVSSTVFRLTRCSSSIAQGLTLGTVAHAIGTARAKQLGDKSAAFATMALCVNGVLTAIILPVIMFTFR